MEKSHTYRMEARTENLEALRKFVESAAGGLGAPAAIVADVILATEEAATNVILHGYRGFPGPIEVDIELQSSALIIRMRDEAAPFDPTTTPKPDTSLPLERRPAGRMGIYLMRRAMDHLHHQIRPCGGNELTLVKILPEPPTK